MGQTRFIPQRTGSAGQQPRAVPDQSDFRRRFKPAAAGTQESDPGLRTSGPREDDSRSSLPSQHPRAPCRGEPGPAAAGWRGSGQAELLLEPVEFLCRLAALVPPLRVNLVRFFGFFAPNASLRKHVVPQPPKPLPLVAGPDVSPSTESSPSPASTPPAK